MLADGDRVAVAVSGGHDSLSLLHLLHIRRSITPEHYAIVAIHILGDARGPDACPGHQPLLNWLAASGLEYVVEPMRLSLTERLPMNCQRCAWNRRSTLFQIAHRLGCNKVAFGHHLDDMVETALLNLLYQGRMASMYPCASYFGGVFSLIRPLMYVTKRELEAFARANGFPDPPPRCPNSDKSRREVIADILSLADQSYQNIRRNVFQAAMHCMELEQQKQR
jgi:tRNA 2-thiocytidine biosynthesis protein TtcA